MTRRRSAVGQLLVASCVVAVLTGGAAAGEYIAVSQQNRAANEVTTRYTVLQQIGGALETDYGTADFAWLYYIGTGQRRYLTPVPLVRPEFDKNLATLRRRAPPGPLRGLTATVRKLTAGDHAARAAVTGASEVREVAQSVNAQADEAGRLRAAEAESNRLRAMAREAGLRIREHLSADAVLREARAALEQMLEADTVSLRLFQGDHLGPRVGEYRDRTLPTDTAVGRVPAATLRQLHDLFRAQSSGVMQNLHGPNARKLAEALTPGVFEAMRRAGVVSVLITPFGVGTDLLGIITAQRQRSDHRWTRAEIDAVESVAAGLGRGLNQARLYEAENRLVEELKALDAAKSDFFATVSHELRAPLSRATWRCWATARAAPFPRPRARCWPPPTGTPSGCGP